MQTDRMFNKDLPRNDPTKVILNLTSINTSKLSFLPIVSRLKNITAVFTMIEHSLDGPSAVSVDTECHNLGQLYGEPGNQEVSRRYSN